MTTKPLAPGRNRTGIGTLAAEVTRFTHHASRGLHDGQAIESERVRWARAADPIGTIPPPSTLKGLFSTVVEQLEGNKPAVLIDKLGERLAFERTGTRLYDAILAKFEASLLHEDGPTRDELAQIREDEHRHFQLARDAMHHIGGDPTAMTPSADLVAAAAQGFIHTITDPRTRLIQCLSLILVVELADNDGWQLLIELADSLGFTDMSAQFRTALLEEQHHLLRVREWVASGVLGHARGGHAHELHH